MLKNGYEVVIGLEIHAQLKTASKMFCRCANKLDSKNTEGGEKLEEPNTRVCNVCLGMPGSLPVANKQAIEWTALLGLALSGEIPEKFNFERKNYFYPDLPKGYQISSATNPPVIGGGLEIETEEGIKQIRIHHIHLEEDAGKLVHNEGSDYSLVDLNRAGTPLMEIVTEPDISSPLEAKVFLESLRGILKYLEISDAEMEKGQLRCDANISLKKEGEKILGAKVEIKNLNSFKMVARALEYEIDRQSEILISNNKVVQETRGWNDAKGKTISQRSKEDAMDYRYFPEPDLPPIVIGRHGIDMDLELTRDGHGAIDVDEIWKLIPELPKEKRERFISEYGLSEKDSFTLTSDLELANYFEKTLENISEIDQSSESERNYAKKVSNWILNELLGRLNERGETIGGTAVKPEHLASLIRSIESGEITGKNAKEVLDEMVLSGRGTVEIVKEKGFKQLGSKAELEKIIDEIISKNPKQVEEYKQGKVTIIGFFVGQVMARSKGAADPKTVNEILRKRLK